MGVLIRFRQVKGGTGDDGGSRFGGREEDTWIVSGTELGRVLFYREDVTVNLEQ